MVRRDALDLVLGWEWERRKKAWRGEGEDKQLVLGERGVSQWNGEGWENEEETSGLSENSGGEFSQFRRVSLAFLGFLGVLA